MTTASPDDRNRLNHSILDGDVDRVRTLLKLHPHLVDAAPQKHKTWLGIAVRSGSEHFGVSPECQIPIMQLLVDHGCDVNAQPESPDRTTALGWAVSLEDGSAFEFLLRHGADPRLGRPMIGAINVKNPQLRMERVRLLVEHGADVNQLYELYDSGRYFTALDWGGDIPDVADYLLSLGAKKAADLLDDPETLAFPDSQESGTNELIEVADEIAAFFEEHFGPVQRQALIEIVPTEPTIAVHAIPATESRNHVTLFTTGMAEQPMAVPEGEEEYQYAEIFIQLPGDWKYMDIEDPTYGWPIHWLRSTAKYPHQNDTWLGGPVTIIANGDPPEPLAPNVEFTSVLLMAERQFTSADGRTIQLYRMTPLYTEERDLELREGIAALMHAFDQQDIPFVVDLSRPNVAPSTTE